MIKMVVVADDFTGANDTGVQLARQGARTEVMLTAVQSPSRQIDVLVLNTESRALPAAEAAERVRKALAPWCRAGAVQPLVYKKIDSTLRGNVGAEIEATMQLTGKRLAIVAAAIPAAGRITRNGECLVHGVPLLESEFASDPKTPIVSSRIQQVLAAQSNLPIHELGLTQVRGGQLAEALRGLAAGTGGMVVLDAELESDLRLIAEAVGALETPPLLVGAAGLAAALPARLFISDRRQLPVLVVAGSMSEATRRQVTQARERGRAQIIDVDIARCLTDEGDAECQRLTSQACQVLLQGEHCILRTSRSADDRHQIAALCQRFGLSRQQLGERLSAQLGALTSTILSRATVGGLFLTGGDIAIAVASALGAQGYRIQGEVAACIPCGTFVNSEIDDLPVITKAGGFGSDSTLCDALSYIEEMYSDQ